MSFFKHHLNRIWLEFEIWFVLRQIANCEHVKPDDFMLPKYARIDIRDIPVLKGDITMTGKDGPPTQYISVTQSCPTLHNMLQSGLQHARLPCPSLISKTCSNSCSLSQWCHQTISSSFIPFFSCLQSFPASGSFPVSQFFPSGGQSMWSTGEGNGKPLQYSCLENPMNSKKWQKDMMGLKRVQNLARKTLLRIILFDLRLCLLHLQGWHPHFSDPVGLSCYACIFSTQDWYPQDSGTPFSHNSVGPVLWFQIAIIWSAETGEIDPHPHL